MAAWLLLLLLALQLRRQQQSSPLLQPPPQPRPAAPRLSARLRQVLELTSIATATSSRREQHEAGRDATVVADVGADHAHLSVALVREGVADRVVAVDRCRSPLRIGEDNARAAGLLLLPPPNDRIDFRLGDGLGPLRPDDGVSVVCVAGMGARSMTKILAGGEESGGDGGGGDDDIIGGDACDALRRLNVRHLVLQPVNPHPQHMIPLRRWLARRRWAVRDETIMRLGKRSYLTLLASDVECSGTTSSTGADGHTALAAAANTKIQDEDLILPRSIRSRARAMALNLSITKYQQQQQAAPQTRRRDDAEEELEAWRDYVGHYARWAASADLRSDTYDRDVGISREVIADILRREAELLGLGKFVNE